MDPLQQMGPNLEKKELRNVLFLTFYILLQGVFLLYSLYNLYEPVQCAEMEGYYAEVQCSTFHTTNCIQSTYFLDLTSH